MPPDPGPHNSGPSAPTLASIAITFMVLVAAAATIALFMIPVGNAWFWPTLGVLVVSAGLALAIPLKKRL